MNLRCWDVSVEYLLIDHDPRRYKPLIDFCLNTALNADFHGGSAFDRMWRSCHQSETDVYQSRAGSRSYAPLPDACNGDSMLGATTLWICTSDRSLVRMPRCGFSWHRYSTASIRSRYVSPPRVWSEYRQFYPSFASAAALVDAVLSDPKAENDFMQIRTGRFMPQLQNIMSSFPKWKEERPHGPKAALSDHDTAASTGKS